MLRKSNLRMGKRIVENCIVRITKTLIRLHICAVRSGTLLFAHTIFRLSFRKHVVYSRDQLIRLPWSLHLLFPCVGLCTFFLRVISLADRMLSVYDRQTCFAGISIRHLMFVNVYGICESQKQKLVSEITFYNTCIVPPGSL